MSVELIGVLIAVLAVGVALPGKTMADERQILNFLHYY